MKKTLFLFFLILIPVFSIAQHKNNYHRFTATEFLNKIPFVAHKSLSLSEKPILYSKQIPLLTTVTNQTETSKNFNLVNPSFYLIITLLFIILFGILTRFFILYKKKNKLIELRNNKIKSQKELIRKNADLLLQNTQELLSLNVQKDKFYSVISHDLRGFVSTIKGFADLLFSNKKTLSEEKIEKYISLISKTADSTMDLLNNLLEWSRSQQGKLMYNPEKINLYDIIKDVLYFLEPMVEKKTITIINKIEQNSFVLGDKGMLFSVLRNLISNAIKFTYPKGEISIFAENQEDIYIIHVKDNGVGISKNDILKLFVKEKIYSTLGTHDEPGSGMGLQICKEFIDTHNQEIGVKSSIGKGSDFWFTLNKSNS